MPDQNYFCGPFIDGNGNVYLIVQATNKRDIRVYKATNPETSFALQDSGGQPTDGTAIFPTIWCIQDGDTLHLTSFNIDGAYEHHKFYTSDHSTTPDEWDNTVVRELIEAPSDPSAAAELSCSIAVRSDGTVVVLYNGSEDKVKGCFAGDTPVLTQEGVRPIGELAGTTQKLLTRNPGDRFAKKGFWVDAEIKSFGVQPLMRLILVSEDTEKEIYATPGHRWFVRTDLGVKELHTDQLRKGDVLASVAEGPVNHIWRVLSAEATDRVEEVFCAVVPIFGAFALDDDILTGNSPYARVDYNIRSSGGTWGGPVTVVANEKGEVDWFGSVIVLDTDNDMCHFFFKDDTNSDAKHRSLNASNSLSAIEDVDTSAYGFTTAHIFAPGIYVLDGSNHRITAPYIDSDGTISMAHVVDDGTPTVTTGVSDNIVKANNLSPVACAAKDGTDAWLLYADQPTLDLWSDTSATPHTSGWTTDVEREDAVTINRISCNIYTRSGSKVLAWVEDNAGTIRYNELSLTAPKSTFMDWYRNRSLRVYTR
jgi:hypothetical protein